MGACAHVGVVGAWVHGGRVNACGRVGACVRERVRGRGHVRVRVRASACVALNRASDLEQFLKEPALAKLC